MIQGRRTATLLIGGGAGEPRSAPLTRLADADAAPPAVKTQGMSLAALTDLARVGYGFDASVDGVEVSAVDAKAPAAKGVRLGDVIKEINLQPARNPAEAVSAFEALKRQGKKTALLLLVNGAGEFRFLRWR